MIKCGCGVCIYISVYLHIQGTKLKLRVVLRWPHWPLTDSCRPPIQILSCRIIVCIRTLIYIEAPHACVNSMLLFYTLHLSTKTIES